MLTNKAKRVTVLLIALCVLATGRGLFGHSAPPSSAPLKESAPRTDLSGDPLPPDALLRLGTMRHRCCYWWKSRHQPLPDGKTALFSTPREIRWLDAVSGKVLKTWRLPKGQTVSGFSNDGRLALLREGDTPRTNTQMHVWDLAACKEVQVLKVSAVSGDCEAIFAPDGKSVVTVHGVNFNPGLVRMWDLATGKELWPEGVMGFYDRGLYPLGFSADRATLLVLDKAKSRISLRNRVTGKERRAFDTMPLSQTRCWCLAPDARTVLMGTDGPAVRAWDVATGKELPRLGGHVGQARSVAFSRDGRIVLTGGEGPFVLVWDWPAGKVRRKIELADNRGLGGLSVPADGQRAEITIFGELAPRFYALKTGKELPPSQPAHRGPCLAWSLLPTAG